MLHGISRIRQNSNTINLHGTRARFQNLQKAQSNPEIDPGSDEKGDPLDGPDFRFEKFSARYKTA